MSAPFGSKSSRAVHAHCYRMLGSLEDADDALQEALLRAWRGLEGFQRRSSIRTWLYKIATNSCLQLAARRPKRRLPSGQGPAAAPHTPPGEPLSETVWIEPYLNESLEVEDRTGLPAARYEERESVELAFVAALQHLPPRPRAVLLLRDVLAFSAREVAELLDTTVPSVNSASQRARHTVDERSRAEPAGHDPLARRRTRTLARRLVHGRFRAGRRRRTHRAPHRGRRLGHATAANVVPGSRVDRPVPRGARGHGRLAASSVRASGQLAVGCYVWSAEDENYTAAVLDVLTLRGDRIAEVTAFVTPRLFACFGLPDRLAD